MIARRPAGNQPGMKTLRLLCALSLALAVPALAGPKLELEVGAGGSGTKAAAATLTGRIGVDLLDWFTPSVRVVTLTPLGGAPTALAVLGEVRAHTSGKLQLTAGVGVGVATATFVPGATGVDATVARATPWLQGDVGLRVVLGPFFVGLGVGGAPAAQRWMATLSVGVAAFGG